MIILYSMCFVNTQVCTVTYTVVFVYTKNLYNTVHIQNIYLSKLLIKGIHIILVV